MAFCPFNSSAQPGLSWISVLVGRREQEGQDEEDLQGKSYDCAYCYPVPHQRPNVLFEIWSSLVLPGIFKTKVVKSRFQQEPIIASEIEECTRKTWYQDLEMLIYEFGKVFFNFIMMFLDSSAYKADSLNPSLLNPSPFILWCVWNTKGWVICWWFVLFLDTPAGDCPSKNRVANFLETREHTCWLHLCTRKKKYLFTGPCE